MQVLEKQVKQAITTRLEYDVELKAALILLDDSWGSATDAGTPRMSAGDTLSMQPRPYKMACRVQIMSPGATQ